MPWVDRLLATTNWEDRRFQLPWESIEQQLQTRLPHDYKRVCEAFGNGEFSSFAYVLSYDEAKVFDLVSNWLNFTESRDAPLASAPEFSGYSLYEPYALYRAGGTGLLPWGYTYTECDYYWLVDSPDPTEWSIVARQAPPSPWHRYEMTTSEFLVRVLTDEEFLPFSIARTIPDRFFDPAT